MEPPPPPPPPAHIPAVHLGYRLTFGEQFAGVRRALRRGRAGLLLLALLAVGSVAIALGSEAETGAGRIVAGVLWFVLMYLFVAAMSALVTPGVGQDHVLVAFEGGLRSRMGDLEADTAWPAGMALLEARRVVVLTAPGRAPSIVPIRAFPDEASRERLRDLVAAQTERAPQPYASTGPRPLDPGATSDADTIRLSYELTRTELLRAQLRTLVRPSSVVALVGAPVAIGVLAGHALVGLVVGVVLLGLVLGRVLWTAYGNPMYRLPAHHAYDERGFDVYANASRLRGPWSCVSRVLSAGDSLQVVLGRRMFVVPTRAFASPAERERFLDLVARNVG